MSRDDLEKIALAIENVLRIRGARGYSAGHPIKNRAHKVPLGNSKYEMEKNNSTDDDKLKLVDVSRAFKKRR